MSAKEFTETIFPGPEDTYGGSIESKLVKCINDGFVIVLVTQIGTVETSLNGRTTTHIPKFKIFMYKEITNVG